MQPDHPAPDNLAPKVNGDRTSANPPGNSPVGVSEARMGGTNDPLRADLSLGSSGPRSRAHSSSRLPRSRPWTRGRVLATAGLVLAVFVGGIGAMFYLSGKIIARTPFT